jgi:hypothetical protein
VQSNVNKISGPAPKSGFDYGLKAQDESRRIFT